jgi:hypothetical protein
LRREGLNVAQPSSQPAAHWNRSEEALIQQVMNNHGYSREEAIDRLVAFGGL